MHRHFISQLQYEVKVVYSCNCIIIRKTGQFCWTVTHTLVTDELALRCSCSTCSEELKGTESPSRLLQLTDPNVLHDNVSPPGRSSTKKHLQERQCAAGQLFQQSQNTVEIPVSFQITCRPRIPSPTDHGPPLSHKQILWHWRCCMSKAIIDESRHQVLPFHTSAI